MPAIARCLAVLVAVIAIAQATEYDLISGGTAGPGNGDSLRPAISRDGRFVAFQ